jgi:arginase family enzyme
MPTVARRVPGVRFLWIDAHGDFNTPDTTPSGFLGGMCLGAACGRWDAGWPDTIDPGSVSFLGVRDLDPGEKVEVEAAGVGEGVPAEGPVYVHLDVDGLDPSVMPVQFPVPGGLQAAEVRDVLARLVGEGRLVGLEVTAFEHPEHVDLVLEILEPVVA